MTWGELEGFCDQCRRGGVRSAGEQQGVDDGDGVLEDLAWRQTAGFSLGRKLEGSVHALRQPLGESLVDWDDRELWRVWHAGCQPVAVVGAAPCSQVPAQRHTCIRYVVEVIVSRFSAACSDGI